MRTIARIYTDFDENFGIPRQSGLAEDLKGEIVFEKMFRDPNAVRGLEEFSHIWVLWRFDHGERSASAAHGADREPGAAAESGEDKVRWQPTVRPPRLGGNERMGVFATRSPFRPNPVGLSCVKIEELYIDPEKGPVLRVSGIDMRNGTEIYDIKPYLPHIDARPEAKGGFAQSAAEHRLTVDIPEELMQRLPKEKRKGAVQMLEQDPRPGYQRAPERVYGVTFAGKNIRFRVEEDRLTVIDII